MAVRFIIDKRDIQKKKQEDVRMGKWTPSLGDKPERRLSQAICRFATSRHKSGEGLRKRTSSLRRLTQINQFRPFVQAQVNAAFFQGNAERKGNILLYAQDYHT